MQLADILSKKDRLLAIIDHYTDGNQRKFADLLGVQAQTVNSWIRRDTFDMDLVYANCSGISADWLLSGQGNMLKNEHSTHTIEKYQYRSDSEIIEIENPPIVPRELTKRPNLDTLELVKNDDEELIASRVKIDGLAFSMWVRVGDAALEPHYHPEDKLALIAYPHGQERPIYGKVHGIDTISNGMILRRLYPHPDGYIAKSYAPDEFPDLFIPHDDIIRVYRALVQVRTL
jgi:hypothetical protein